MRKMGGRSACSTQANVAYFVSGFRTWGRRGWVCSHAPLFLGPGPDRF